MRGRSFATGVALVVAVCSRLATAQAQASGAAPGGPGAHPASGLRTGPHDAVINGVRLWYRVAGTSAPETQPVVFLHGGPGSSSYAFAAMAGPRLERALRMVYFDQRGSGRSERPWTRHYQLDTLVEDIEGLRRALGVPQIAVVGHSFGGILALEYAARYPERVSRLVLVAAASDMPATCRVHRERLAAAHPEALARVIADTVDSAGVRRSDCDMEFRALRGPDREAFNNAGIFRDSSIRRLQDSVEAASGLRNTGELQRAIFASGLFNYRFSAPARLTMPTLVIAGRYDGAIGLHPQRALAGALPSAKFLEYEHSAHVPYLEEPDRFARDLIAFLAAPTAPRPSGGSR